MFHFLLAILALGLLIFFHELGHYWVARREGMRVEAFAIGFGKPIFTWQYKGVEWRLCMLPFGGYVKIAGMQREGSREPYEIADGFYAQRPMQRIRVLLAGPVVNIILALLAFTALWAMGGRDKPFAEFTHRIGWVDPDSELYQKGVRPGDWISEYDGRQFDGFRDLIMASVMDDGETQIAGYKIDDATGERVPYDYTLSTYSANEDMLSVGVMAPARYLIVQGPLPSESPMIGTGMQPGDRIVWANGERLYSMQQLSALINDSSAYMTLERDGQLLHTRVPRVKISDLKFSAYERGELDDWQHSAGVKGNLSNLSFIPYNLSSRNTVERHVDFIDPADQTRAFSPCQRCTGFTPLQEGDRILAVDGQPVNGAADFMAAIQTRRVLVIVQRDPTLLQPISWKEADLAFDNTLETGDLNALVASIGTDQPLSDTGTLHLLPAVTPKAQADFSLTAPYLEASKKKIEAMEDAEERNAALAALDREQQRLLLGVALQDRPLIYNPSPLTQAKDVLVDTYRSLHGLFSGALHAKYMTGPVGIVAVVQQSWSLGVKEAIYWVGLISMSLGIFNLLPIPALDGGHIAFALYEQVTGQKVKSKIMERMIIPFLVLLVLMMLYATYNDILRIFF